MNRENDFQMKSAGGAQNDGQAYTRPLVSVVIPVFNISIELLERCVSSIQSQTYDSIEIVIVDDGSSSDCSRDIDVLYQRLGNRARVIHQENQGVSAARNNGVKAASGEYLMFVDPDDILIGRECINQAVTVIQECKVDAVYGRVSYRFANIEDDYPFGFGCGKARVYASQQDIASFAQFFFAYGDPVGSDIPSHLNRGPVARLMRKDFVESTPFDVRLAYAEDAIFNSEFVRKCSSIALVDDVWYGYYQYAESSSHSERLELCNQYCKIALEHVADDGAMVDSYFSFCRHIILSSCLVNVRAKGPAVFADVKDLVSAEWAQDVFRACNLDLLAIPKWEAIGAALVRKRRLNRFCIFLLLSGFALRAKRKRLLTRRA